MSTPVYDAALLRRHDRPGPRYTSYPSALQFNTSFGLSQLRQHLAHHNASGEDRPLSLYLHIPFCLSPCFYCGCNRIITRDASRGERYTDRLLHEIDLIAPLLDVQREVVQVHLGGGTPNFLAEDSLTQLIAKLDAVFNLSADPQRDFSIELDPRSVPETYPLTLARLGFNRVSLGVQDFDSDVQLAVNRIQSIEQTVDLIDACRDHGIRSVNVDLIYGLPRQTLEGFRRTLRTVISARPDRLAVYGYAHLPALFKPQRHIDPTTLPAAEQRLELLRLAVEELTMSGYQYIGMDHFALPDDDLVRAQAAGELQRNFMGYTTHANCDLVGLGVSAISHIGNSFSQNFRDLKAWQAAVDEGRLPLWRGLTLTPDDCVRGEVVSGLMCQGAIDVGAIERRHGIDFATYFRTALESLQPHFADGLVHIKSGQIVVTATGRLLLRSIAMCFDAYLQVGPNPADAPPFSKVI